MPNEISANLNTLVSRPAQVQRPQLPGSSEPDVERQTLPQNGQTFPPLQQKEQSSETQRRELDEAVSRIQDYVQNLQRELQFTVDQQSGRTIITVIDSETDKIIRQIPPEEILALSEYLQSASDGLLLKVQA